MNKEKYLHFIASFLIVLVLTIPFYVTSVHATINTISVKGGDGIEGFAKENDFLDFNVQASIPDDKITNDQIFLGNDIQFDSCTGSITNGSDCTLRFPSNGTETFEVTSVPFTINLFKDDGTLDDSESGNVTIDNLPPTVNLSVSQTSFSSAQDVVVTYTIDDFACNDVFCTGKCVGIDNIEFFTLDGTFGQTVDIDSTSCTVQADLSVAPTSFVDGLNSVFAKATDKFGQVSPDVSVTFTVDASSPSILADTFQILVKGVSIDTFSSNTVTADLVVNISASDLDLNSVTADISALNPDLNITNAQALCVFDGIGMNTCTWSIQYNPETEGVKTVIVNASDTTGNEASASMSKSLTLDNNGPVVLSLTSNKVFDNIVLVSATGNTITSVFDEASGLSVGDVFLHIDGTSITPTSCNENGQWSCSWQDVSFASSGDMSIESDTMDVLGNAVNQTFTTPFTLDSSAPVLNSLNLSPVGGITPAFAGFFKVGDKISVVADLTEENGVAATADFSNYIDGATSVAGSCSEVDDNKHLCTWLTDSIDFEADSVITFNFTDSAGNVLVVTEPLNTFGLENSSAPDFWSNTVSCSPATVDRQLGPLINQRVYCTMSLTPKTSTEVSTVFIGPASCIGDTSIVEQTETTNTDPGSISPIITFTLIKDSFNIDSATLSCSLDIFSQVGDSTSITQNPEVETANINIGFFNLPLGELSTEVQDKIDEAIEDAQGIWDLIGTLNKLVFYAKKICQIINTIYNIVAVLLTVVVILDITAIATKAYPFLGVTFERAAQTGCEGETSFRVVAQDTNTGLNKFCSYTNCKQTILWGPTVQNWINNNANLLTPGPYVGPQTEIKGEGLFTREVVIKGQKTSLFSRPVSEYMDPNRNIAVAALFACIPGIIYGLDKYRQILCLYADCLQTAVAEEGLPVSACEDQKSYATCKYLMSELFAVFPWTAVFDHFMGIIKNSLSNPFAALGAGISFACGYVCKIQDATLRKPAFYACETVRSLSQIGSIAQDVQDIIENGFTIRTDYCERLEEND